MNYLTRTIISILTLSLLFSACDVNIKPQSDIPPNKVLPSPQQIKYQQMELVGFIHFTVNTFTDNEWGYGDENPEIFNPSDLDVEQWVLTAKAGGLKELILTAKHHDGFCLWPSHFTEHSLKNSPYMDGNGDIVKDFVNACNKHGLKAGLYLSPWDRNHKDYGKPEYITFYRNQLKELLTNYGEINEIWFDGANGGDGYYGGANEVRMIDKKSYYDWENTCKLVKELQPEISIFSDAGPDIRWIGNEHGFAGETCWSPIKKDQLTIGGSNQQYLNTGDPDGDEWILGQCDVSIRPGWFYHKDQDTAVKSAQELVDIYYKSVGRNAVLLLNLPPDKRGLIHENDSTELQKFKKILDETFSHNLLENESVTASNNRLNNAKFSPDNIIDKDMETYWATDDGITYAELIFHLANEDYFDRILIQEPIAFGQRISKFQIQALIDSGWQTIFEGTTIGYKKLIRIEPISTSQVKLLLMESNNIPAISNMGIYKSSKGEKDNY